MSGVEIRVRSNSRQARNDLNKLEQSVKNIETRTAAAGKAFRNLAIGIGAAFSGGVAVKGINNAADSLTNLENRIALVTGRGKDLDKTMNSLFKIAKRTRGDIAGSADTFNRFGIALKGTGRSSEDLLKAVTSVNKAVAISGSSAESARGALVQLGQGLAAGQLRGEELNSVLEAAPRLAQAIADEMKVPLGAIRAIAQDGKLTTELVFNALINQAEALSAEFETMEGTSEQAFSVMKDQISRVVAEISKGLGITDKFTDRFNAISDSLETNRDAIVSGVVGAFQAVGSIFSGINTVATGIISIVAQVVDYIKELVGFSGTKIELFDNKAFSLAEKSLSSIVGSFAAIKLDASIVKNALDNVADFLVKTFNTLGSYKDDALKSVAKYSKIASDNFKELYDRAVRFSLIKYVEFRGGKGVIKDYINYLKLLRVQRQVEASASRMFKTTADFAKKYLSQAWNSVKTFLNLIERKFYWVYDEVIQNSWWTDTMEQTYFLSEKWLGKASAAVGRFGNTVNQKFKGVFESFKSGASAFKDQLTISNVKIKFASLKDKFSNFASGFKDSVTSGLKSAMDGLSQLSPVISAGFGAALVAGVTRFLSPELFKKTFGKIGPAAIAILFAGIATDLAEVLKDAGIFSQLGANLGTTLAIAFDAVLGAIPVLVDGLIQGVSSAGEAFGKALEGSILGLPAKLLSFVPGGGLLTSILYGSLGLAAISGKFRTALFGMIASAVSRSSTLTSGAGMLSSIFYGEKFTSISSRANELMISSANISDKAQKKSVQKASTNMTALAGKARAAHLGIMGVFAAGSVALFGDTLGAELSGIIGLVAGNIASSMLLTGTSFADLKLRFAGLRSSITTGSFALAANVYTSFKVMAVSANTSMASMGTTSKITSASIATNFKRAAASAIASFKKLGKVGRFAIAGIAASLLFTSAAYADVGEAGGEAAEKAAFSSATIADSLLNIGLAALTVGSLMPSVGKKFGKLFKALGTRSLAPLAAGFSTAFGSIGATVTASAGLVAVGSAAIYGAIAAAVTAVASIAAVSIYSIFFGEGDTFKQRLRSNTQAIKEAIFGVKRNITGVRAELAKVTTDIEDRLGRIDIDVDISANISNANLAAFTTNEQTALEEKLAKLGKLQQRANSDQATYGKVSNKLLEEIRLAALEINESVLKSGGSETLGESNTATFKSLAKAMSTAVRVSVEADSSIFRGVLSGDIDKIRAAEDPNFQQKINAQAPQNALLQTLNKFIPDGALDTDEQRKSFAIQGLQAISAAGDSVGEGLQQFEALLKLLLAEGGVVTGNVQKALDALANTELSFDANVLTGSIGGTNILSPEVQAEIDRSAGAATFEQGRQVLGLLRSELSNLLDAQGFGDVGDLEVLGIEELKKALSPLRGVSTTLNAITRGSKSRDDIANSTDAEAAVKLAQAGASDEEIALLQRARSEATLAVKDLTEILNPLPQGFNTLNAALANLNIPTLETSGIGNGFVGQAKVLADLNHAQARQLELSEEIQKIEEVGAGTKLERLVQTQALTTEMANNRTQMAGYVDLLNAANVTGDEIGVTLQNSLNIDDYDFDVGKLLALGPKDLSGILQAQIEVETLGIQLAQLAASGNLVNALGQSGEDINKALVAARAALATKLVGLGVGKKTASGGKQETIFEKFVGGLNASGFNIDIAQAAALGGAAIDSLQGPLKAIKDAQERIKNASLGDNAARIASLGVIEKQRKAIAGILTSGTVGQANIGLEGLGVDSSLATNAANTDALIRISGLQDDLNETLFTDFEARKRITSEILIQQRLLEGVTAGAEASTEAVKGSIKESFSGLLKGTMSFKDAITGILDTISSQIIDTVVGSLVDAMFDASGMQDMFSNFFAGLFASGSEVGKKAGEGIGDAITDGIGGATGGGADGLFSQLGEGFSGLLSSLGEGLSSIFSSIGSLFGGGGSGGGFFSSILGLFGGGATPKTMSQGGTVPNTPYSQAGKDSVPAMLMPGEVVMSKNAVSRMGNNSSGSTQQFNINVSGDVSRQTRKEIVKMMPQIAGGVNMQNKENNFKR